LQGRPIRGSGPCVAHGIRTRFFWGSEEALAPTQAGSSRCGFVSPTDGHDTERGGSMTLRPSPGPRSHHTATPPRPDPALACPSPTGDRQDRPPGGAAGTCSGWTKNHAPSGAVPVAGRGAAWPGRTRTPTQSPHSHSPPGPPRPTAAGHCSATVIGAGPGPAFTAPITARSDTAPLLGPLLAGKAGAPTPTASTTPNDPKRATHFGVEGSGRVGSVPIKESRPPTPPAAPRTGRGWPQSPPGRAGDGRRERPGAG
jgi:hypothetical protein